MKSGMKSGSRTMSRFRAALLPLLLHLAVAGVGAFEPKDAATMLYLFETSADPNAYPEHSSYPLSDFVEDTTTFDKYLTYDKRETSTADRLKAAREIWEAAEKAHEKWKNKLETVQHMADKVGAGASSVLRKHLEQLSQACSPHSDVEILSAPELPWRYTSIDIKNPRTYEFMWGSHARAMEQMQKKIVALYAFVITQNGMHKDYKANEQFKKAVWKDPGYKTLFWACTDVVLKKGAKRAEYFKRRVNEDPDYYIRQGKYAGLEFLKNY